MNSVGGEHSLEEIVNFINLTSFKTDINLFERLNCQEILDIYINCLIYLGKASNFNDFEINIEEENLFASVVKENKGPKILKVTSIINRLFKKNGFSPTFSPVYIFSPSLNITQSTLGRLLDIKNKMEENKNQYYLLSHDYQYTIKSYENLYKSSEDAKEEKELLLSTIEEGKKIIEDLENDIKNYINNSEEILPKVKEGKENSKILLEELTKKDNKLKQLTDKFEERYNTFNKLKEHIVPEPEKLIQIIENNQAEFNEFENKINETKIFLDDIFGTNEALSKTLDKLLHLKLKVEGYNEIEIKFNKIQSSKEENKKQISKCDKERIKKEEKYKKEADSLKGTEILYKNQQKEFNNYKLKIIQQNKEIESIKNDLKETLDHITQEMIRDQSEIDKIYFEKNEINILRDEYADILSQKFKEIEKKQKIFYSIFNKSLELYMSYDIGQKNREGKNN